MEELKFFYHIFKEHGSTGLFVAYMLYKELYPQYKKYRGKYISYETIMSKVEAVESRMVEHRIEDQRHFSDIEGMKSVQEEMIKNIMANYLSIRSDMDWLRKEVSGIKDMLILKIAKP